MNEDLVVHPGEPQWVVTRGMRPPESPRAFELLDLFAQLADLAAQVVVIARVASVTTHAHETMAPAHGTDHRNGEDDADGQPDNREDPPETLFAQGLYVSVRLSA